MRRMRIGGRRGRGWSFIFLDAGRGAGGFSGSLSLSFLNHSRFFSQFQGHAKVHSELSIQQWKISPFPKFFLTPLVISSIFADGCQDREDRV